MNHVRVLRISFLAISVTFALNSFATDWLQFGYDQAHSSNNTAEPGYATATGNKLVPAFASGVSLAHQADSAPIFVGGVTTASGVKDVLFINSLDGTLVALDAKNGSLIWSKQPTPAGGTNGTLAQGGITGSPAVDSSRQYVYAYGLDGKVHKYKVGDGTETLTGNWPEVSTVKPESEKGASGISIATVNGGATYLYAVMNGYDGDGGDYQGHITTVNLATGAQNVFNSECSNLTIHFVKNGITSGTGQNDCASRQNGIWGRPGAIYDSGTNRLFISIANGPFNANTSGGFDWGDSVLALNPDGTGSGNGMPIDSYTPMTYQKLQSADADLGSVSIAIVPAPPGTATAYKHIAVQPGKDGCVRLINLADMSGQGAPAHTGGEVDAKDLNSNTHHCATGDDGPEIKPQPAVWVNSTDSSSWIYVASYFNGFVAYKISLDGSGKPSLSQQWTANSGASPVVSNGLVYYVTGGHVRALDAVTGTSVWDDTAIGDIHWQSPILVNGHLYVIDSGSKLWSYALDGIFKNGLQ